MTDKQRLQAIANVRERLDVLLHLALEGDASIFHGYNDTIAENITDAVLALTSDDTPEERAKVARHMLQAQQRARRLRWAETRQ